MKKMNLCQDKFNDKFNDVPEAKIYRTGQHCHHFLRFDRNSLLLKSSFSIPLSSTACLREAPPPRASCGGQALRRRQGRGIACLSVGRGEG